MMTIAIMQPYFFPYIGYWQLIHAVNRFVICDDVNYITGGWINRNRILINGDPAYITMPLSHASQNKHICRISLLPGPVWQNQMVKSIEHAYRRAPFFAVVFPVVERLIRHEAENLSDYLTYQLQTMVTFMGINTEFVMTSRCYKNAHLSGQARVLDICRREGATTYINPQGGRTLYATEAFRAEGLDLHFIVMRPLPYKQRASWFVPYLSIIDALMEIGPVEIMHHLMNYDLI
ncbi:WbqC family protein [Candidatus Brocadia pituitae]|nr:WbqC family protein [Candidatus Brocadia pituitae]